MRVFITGGTGLVGLRLVHRLLDRKDQPVVLTRSASRARGKLPPEVEIVEGDPMQTGPWMATCAACDAVINLVGENVLARRWNAAFKKLLIESRTLPTRHVVAALRDHPTTAAGQPRVLVNASAIGYYGPRGDEELDENTPPAHDFFGSLCAEWEKEAMAALAFGIRVCTVRVGIVLDKTGGALAKMLTPFRWGVGGRLGSGRQWMSWIHHDDLVGLFLLPLDNPRLSGALNGTAPNPVTNSEFTRTLGKVLHRPTWLPAPAWGLRLLLGEMANALVTGQRVLPRASLAQGFTFRYPTLEPALRAALA
jgi:uncharacterized protein (TIGR01777 family)